MQKRAEAPVHLVADSVGLSPHFYLSTGTDNFLKPSVVYWGFVNAQTVHTVQKFHGSKSDRPM
jgi:hypothetical protein